MGKKKSASKKKTEWVEEKEKKLRIPEDTDIEKFIDELFDYFNDSGWELDVDSWKHEDRIVTYYDTPELAVYKNGRTIRQAYRGLDIIPDKRFKTDYKKGSLDDRSETKPRHSREKISIDDIVEGVPKAFTAEGEAYSGLTEMVYAHIEHIKFSVTKQYEDKNGKKRTTTVKVKLDLIGAPGGFRANELEFELKHDNSDYSPQDIGNFEEIYSAARKNFNFKENTKQKYSQIMDYLTKKAKGAEQEAFNYIKGANTVFSRKLDRYHNLYKSFLRPPPRGK